MNILAQREMQRISTQRQYFNQLYYNLKMENVGKVKAILSQINGKNVVNSLDDYLPNNELRHPDSSVVLSQDDTSEIRNKIASLGANLTFLSKIIGEKQCELQPYSPFTIPKLIKFMSKLQNYSTDLLMVSINKLYELGYISIVNSNCATHSSEVKNAARETARVIFGHDVSDDISNSVMFGIGTIHPVIVDNKFTAPENIKHKEMNETILKMYSAIYYNTIASVMGPAEFKSIDIELEPNNENEQMLQNQNIDKIKGLRFTASIKQITQYVI